MAHQCRFGRFEVAVTAEASLVLGRAAKIPRALEKELGACCDSSDSAQLGLRALACVGLFDALGSW